MISIVVTSTGILIFGYLIGYLVASKEISKRLENLLIEQGYPAYLVRSFKHRIIKPDTSKEEK